jgi:hypothetical protein
LKKSNCKKKSIKPIKILKKLTGSVRFQFYKPETEKTEPNRTQTEKNKKNEPNWTKTKSNRTNKAKLKNRAKPV